MFFAKNVLQAWTFITLDLGVFLGHVLASSNKNHLFKYQTPDLDPDSHVDPCGSGQGLRSYLWVHQDPQPKDPNGSTGRLKDPARILKDRSTNP